jgi:hypothetical protein
MAVLCERVEPRDNGTIDVFGIVDGVVLQPAGTDPLGLEPAAVISLNALVSLKAGSRRGPQAITLQGIYPNGAAGASITRLVEFTDALPGATFVVPLELQVHEPGTYGFDLRCEDEPLTRITLQVNYA